MKVWSVLLWIGHCHLCMKGRVTWNYAYSPWKKGCRLLWYIRLKYARIKFYCKQLFKTVQKSEVCVVNLWIKHWSPSTADLRINLIPLRYPVVVIPCRDNFNWSFKHWFSNMKVTTLDFKINHSRITISKHKLSDLRIY